MEIGADVVDASAVASVVVAAAVNNLVKSAMAAGIGGRRLGLRVGIPLLVASAGGLLSAWWSSALA